MEIDDTKWHLWEKVLQKFFNLVDTKKELEYKEIFQLLSDVEKLEKKPQYSIETSSIINKTSNTVKNIFTISTFTDKIDDHSKFNIHDVLDYDKLLDFYYEGDDYVVEFNTVYLNWVNKNLLKRQLYYKIYINILTQWKTYWIKNIHKIIDKYINNLHKYNKQWIDNYKAVILWNDRYNKKTIKKFNVNKAFNKEFTLLLSKHFEWSSSLDNIEWYYKYLDVYNYLIQNYKKFVSNRIDNLRKYVSKFENYWELDKTQSKILSNILLKITDYESRNQGIDDMLSVKWIDSLISELSEITDEKRKMIEGRLGQDNNSSNLEFILKNSLLKIKEDYEIIKWFKNQHDTYNSVDLYSKDIEKWEIVFEIIVDNNVPFYDTNWNIIKNPLLDILLLFNIEQESNNFDYIIYKNWFKIIAKKSGILMDDLVDWKLHLSIETDFFNDYDIITKSSDNFDKREYWKKEKLLNNSWNKINSDSDNIDWKINFLWTRDIEILKQLDNSFVRKLVQKDYSTPKLYISKYSNIDYIEWIWIYWKFINIWKVEWYWFWKKTLNSYLWDIYDINLAEEIIKPPIFWEKVHIKFLDNDSQLINLISSDYINLSVMWENSFLKDMPWYETSDDHIFEYNNLDNSFFSPSSFIKNISDKILLLEGHINDYERKRKIFVNNYVSLKSIINKNTFLKWIYFKINSKLKEEINKKNNFWDIEHSKNYIENFLDDLFIELPKKSKDINANYDFIKILKLHFNEIIDIFYLSQSTRKNIILLNRYKDNLSNILSQNTDQELIIDYNFWENTIISIDWINANKLNIKSDNILLKKENYISIPRWVWIKVKVNNWVVSIYVEKTLEDIINEKIDSLDSIYFTSFSEEYISRQKEPIRTNINNHIELKKESIYNRILWMITSSRDLYKFYNLDGVGSFLWTKFLSDIKLETKNFEKNLKK